MPISFTIDIIVHLINKTINFISSNQKFVFSTLIGSSFIIYFFKVGHSFYKRPKLKVVDIIPSVEESKTPLFYMAKIKNNGRGVAKNCRTTLHLNGILDEKKAEVDMRLHWDEKSTTKVDINPGDTEYVCVGTVFKNKEDVVTAVLGKKIEESSKSSPYPYPRIFIKEKVPIIWKKVLSENGLRFDEEKFNGVKKELHLTYSGSSKKKKREFTIHFPQLEFKLVDSTGLRQKVLNTISKTKNKYQQKVGTTENPTRTDKDKNKSEKKTEGFSNNFVTISITKKPEDMESDINEKIEEKLEEETEGPEESEEGKGTEAPDEEEVEKTDDTSKTEDTKEDEKPN